MSQPATTTANTLTASYTSPTNEAFAITTTLPSSSSSSSSKTSHLGALRVAVADAQDTINKELTARMEEDKARDAGAAGAAEAAVDDAKEEENYGEEVQEGDD
ncbi:hypothetical protein MY10362_005706 [Beauveria mimosiformis]